MIHPCSQGCITIFQGNNAEYISSGAFESMASHDTSVFWVQPCPLDTSTVDIDGHAALT